MKSARVKYVRAAVAAVLSGLMSLEPALVSAGESNMWAERRKAMSAPARAHVDNPSDNVLASLPSIANPVLAGTGIKNTAAGLARLDLKGHVPDWIQTAVTPFATIQTARLDAGEKRPTVVLIQDAHLHNEAQHQNGATIEALGKEAKAQGGKLLVGLEGAAAGPIDLSGYKSDNPDVMKEIAWALEAANILSGAEAAAISNVGTPTGSSLIDLVGTEDFALYKANVNALRDAAPFEKSARAALSDLKRELVELKKKHFDANLIRFDSRKEAYEEGTLSLPDYALYLDSVVTATSPNLRDLIEAALIEGSLKFDRVETERKKLLSELVPKLSDGELKGLLQASVMFRAGQLTYSAYYDSIKELAARHGLPLSKFPEMNVYIQYVLKSEAIDHRHLFEEVRQLEGSVQQNLSSTDDQRAVLSLVSDYHLMNKLIDRALIESEWHAYEARRPDVDRILERLAALGGGKPQSLVDMAPKWKAFDAFYDAALKRNNAMVANFAAAIEKSGTRHAVMVAGGFHSEGLSALLEKQNFNVLVLSPKITKQSDGPSSLEFLATGRLPLDELFSGQKLFLPTPMVTAMNGNSTNPTGPAQILPPVSKAAVRLVVASRNGGQVKTENVDVETSRLQVAVGGAGGRGGNGNGTIDLPPLNDGLEVTISARSNTGLSSLLSALLSRARNAVVGTATPRAQSSASVETGQNATASELVPVNTTTAYMGWSRAFGVAVAATLFVAAAMSGLHIDLSLGSAGSLMLQLITVAMGVVAAALTFRSASGWRERLATVAGALAIGFLGASLGTYGAALVMGVAATVFLTAAEESAHLASDRSRRTGGKGVFSLSQLGVVGVRGSDKATLFRGQAAFFGLGTVFFVTAGLIFGLGGISLPLIGIVSPAIGIVAGLATVLGLTLLNEESSTWRSAVASRGLMAIGIKAPGLEAFVAQIANSKFLRTALGTIGAMGLVGGLVALFTTGPILLAAAGVTGLITVIAFVAFFTGKSIVDGNPNERVGITKVALSAFAGSVALLALLPALNLLAIPAVGIYVLGLVASGLAAIAAGAAYSKREIETETETEPETESESPAAKDVVMPLSIPITMGIVLIAVGVGFFVVGALTAAAVGVGAGLLAIVLITPVFMAINGVNDRLQKRQDRLAKESLKAAEAERNRVLEPVDVPDQKGLGKYYRSIRRADAVSKNNAGRAPGEQKPVNMSFPKTFEDAMPFYLGIAAYASQSPAMVRTILRNMQIRMNAMANVDKSWTALQAFMTYSMTDVDKKMSKDELKAELNSLLRRLVKSPAGRALTDEQRTLVVAAWVLARRDNQDIVGAADPDSALERVLNRTQVEMSPAGTAKYFSLRSVATGTLSMRAVSALVSKAFSVMRKGTFRAEVNDVIDAIASGDASLRRGRYLRLGGQLMERIGRFVSDGLVSEDASGGTVRDAGLAKTLDRLLDNTIAEATRIADLAYPARSRTPERQAQIDQAYDRYVTQLVARMLQQRGVGSSMMPSVYEWFEDSLTPDKTVAAPMNPALARAKGYLDRAATYAAEDAAAAAKKAPKAPPVVAGVDELKALGVNTEGLAAGAVPAALDRARRINTLLTGDARLRNVPTRENASIQTAIGSIRSILRRSARLTEDQVAIELATVLADIPSDLPALNDATARITAVLNQFGGTRTVVDEAAATLKSESDVDTVLEGSAGGTAEDTDLEPTATPRIAATGATAAEADALRNLGFEIDPAMNDEEISRAAARASDPSARRLLNQLKFFIVGAEAPEPPVLISKPGAREAKAKLKAAQAAELKSALAAFRKFVMDPAPNTALDRQGLLDVFAALNGRVVGTAIATDLYDGVVTFVAAMTPETGEAAPLAVPTGKVTDALRYLGFTDSDMGTFFGIPELSFLLGISMDKGASREDQARALFSLLNALNVSTALPAAKLGTLRNFVLMALGRAGGELYAPTLEEYEEMASYGLKIGGKIEVPAMVRLKNPSGDLESVAAFFDNGSSLPTLLASMILGRATPLASLAASLYRLANQSSTTASTAAALRKLASVVSSAGSTPDAIAAAILPVLKATGAAAEALFQFAGLSIAAPDSDNAILANEVLGEVAGTLNLGENATVQVLEGDAAPENLVMARTEDGVLVVRVAAKTIDAVAGRLSEAAIAAGTPLASPEAARRLALQTIIAHEIAEVLLGIDHKDLRDAGLAGDGDFATTAPPLTLSRIGIAIAALRIKAAATKGETEKSKINVGTAPELLKISDKALDSIRRLVQSERFARYARIFQFAAIGTLVAGGVAAVTAAALGASAIGIILAPTMALVVLFVLAFAFARSAARRASNTPATAPEPQARPGTGARALIVPESTDGRVTRYLNVFRLMKATKSADQRAQLRKMLDSSKGAAESPLMSKGEVSLLLALASYAPQDKAFVDTLLLDLFGEEGRFGASSKSKAAANLMRRIIQDDVANIDAIFQDDDFLNVDSSLKAVVINVFALRNRLDLNLTDRLTSADTDPAKKAARDAGVAAATRNVRIPVINQDEEVQPTSIADIVAGSQGMQRMINARRQINDYLKGKLGELKGLPKGSPLMAAFVDEVGSHIADILEKEVGSVRAASALPGFDYQMGRTLDGLQAYLGVIVGRSTDKAQGEQLAQWLLGRVLRAPGSAASRDIYTWATTVVSTRRAADRMQTAIVALNGARPRSARVEAADTAATVIPAVIDTTVNPDVEDESVTGASPVAVKVELAAQDSEAVDAQATAPQLSEAEQVAAAAAALPDFSRFPSKIGFILNATNGRMGDVTSRKGGLQNGQPLAQQQKRADEIRRGDLLTGVATDLAARLEEELEKLPADTSPEMIAVLLTTFFNDPTLTEYATALAGKLTARDSAPTATEIIRDILNQGTKPKINGVKTRKAESIADRLARRGFTITEGNRVVVAGATAQQGTQVRTEVAAPVVQRPVVVNDSPNAPATEARRAQLRDIGVDRTDLTNAQAANILNFARDAGATDLFRAINALVATAEPVSASPLAARRLAAVTAAANSLLIAIAQGRPFDLALASLRSAAADMRGVEGDVANRANDVTAGLDAVAGRLAAARAAVAGVRPQQAGALVPVNRAVAVRQQARQRAPQNLLELADRLLTAQGIRGDYTNDDVQVIAQRLGETLPLLQELSFAGLSPVFSEIRQALGDAILQSGLESDTDFADALRDLRDRALEIGSNGRTASEAEQIALKINQALAIVTPNIPEERALQTLGVNTAALSRADLATLFARAQMVAPMFQALGYSRAALGDADMMGFAEFLVSSFGVNNFDVRSGISSDEDFIEFMFRGTNAVLTFANAATPAHQAALDSLLDAATETLRRAVAPFGGTVSRPHVGDVIGSRLVTRVTLIGVDVSINGVRLFQSARYESDVASNQRQPGSSRRDRQRGDAVAAISVGRQIMLGLTGTVLALLASFGGLDINTLISLSLTALAAMASEEIGHYLTARVLGLNPAWSPRNPLNVKFTEGDPVRTPLVLAAGQLAFFAVGAVGVALSLASVGGLPLVMAGLGVVGILAFVNSEGRAWITGMSRKSLAFVIGSVFTRVRGAIASLSRRGNGELKLASNPKAAGISSNRTPIDRASALVQLIKTGSAQPILRQIFDAIRSRNRDGNTFVLPNGRVSIEFDGQGNLTAESVTALSQSEEATIAFRDFLSLKGAQIGAIESAGIQQSLGLGDATLEAFDSATSVDQAVRSLSAFLADPANANKNKAVLTFSTPAEFRAKVVEFIAFARAQTKPIDFNDQSPGDAVARAEAVLRALDAPNTRIKVVGLSSDESAAFAKSLDLSPELLNRMRDVAQAFAGIKYNRTVIFSARQLAMAQIAGVMQVMVLSLYQTVGDQIKAAAIVAIQA